MASHLFKQFTLTCVLFSFVKLAIAEAGVSEQDFYKQGDEFALKAYEEHSSVYARIDAAFDHPYLEKYYLISFHGICMRTFNMSSNNQRLKYLHRVAISNEGLRKSIIVKNINKSSSIECDHSKSLKNIEHDQSVVDGMAGVLLSPLDKELSMHASEVLIELVYNQGE